MLRPTNIIPFWIIVGFVFAVVWPPGAAIVLAIVAYTLYRWIRQAARDDTANPDDAASP